MEPSAPLAPLADSRARLVTLLTIVGILLVMANVGTILSANLVVDHPVWLLAMSARNRHLLLTVAAGIDPVPYALVSFVRLLVPTVAFFLLGKWYGDHGLRWLERQAGGTPASVRWVEKAFDKASSPIVVLMPGSNLVCLLAGARHMPPKRYGLLIVVGIIGRLIFFWYLGKTFQEPLETVLEWIQRYQWWIAGGFLLLTVVQSYRRTAAAAKEQPPPELTELPDPPEPEPELTEATEPNE